MKNVTLVIMTSALLFVLASCSNKNDVQIACTAQYISPSLNFQVVNSSDWTMPVYTTTDIKVYFKNSANKTDSINPILKGAADQKYFSFSVQRAKDRDTCYIKIKNYKLDTLRYTISNTTDPCPRPYIGSLIINEMPSVTIARDAIVLIKK